MSSNDPTEQVRREMVADINSGPTKREALEAIHGSVYDTEQLRAGFEVIGFAAPFAVVRRKSDGVRGTMTFCHSPRFYWGFTPD